MMLSMSIWAQVQLRSYRGAKKLLSATKFPSQFAQNLLAPLIRQHRALSHLKFYQEFTVNLFI